MPPSSLEVWKVLRQSQRRARILSDRIGKKKTRKLLEDAQRELTQRLMQAESLSGPGRTSFTATQLRMTLRQVQEVLRGMAPEMKDVLVEQSRTAAEQATQNVVRYMNAAERQFKGISRPLALPESAMFDYAVNGAESSILRRIASNPQDPANLGVLQRYGVNVVGNFEDRLKQALLQGKPWEVVRAELIGESPFLQQAPGHWAERIVRTETMGALNRANWEANRKADEVLGDVVKILVATFDNRTGWDSYQVHGQIRLPDEPFDWNGRQYMHPPNRPNDREVVITHRVSWPLTPELEPRSDAEVLARWQWDGRRGTPPARPRMTTVPRDSFGGSSPPPAPAPPPIGVKERKGVGQLGWLFPE